METHVRRWHAHHRSGGTGPIYQGRFKPFPIQKGEHLLSACRYVKRSALRANLVARARDWRWSSLWHREQQTRVPWLNAWPLALPDQRAAAVNRPQTDAELDALRRCMVCGAPYGDAPWQQRTATALGLESALRQP
jgi:putative transposase